MEEDVEPQISKDLFESASNLFSVRIKECDDYLTSCMTPGMTAEEKEIFAQAAAGLLHTKQFYFYAVKPWKEGDPGQPPPPDARKWRCRNRNWDHLFARDVLLMPDKWEYPFFAAWDLAFHCIAMAEIDIEFAKQQLLLLCREWYMAPSGALPAYEFAFDDVNPPVHAYGVWKVYRKTQENGEGDRVFLASAFHKLLLNWSWWVNRKDPQGRNIFGGGFLGLDNISVFDRSSELPSGGHLEQADGTAWIGFFCNTMFKIALELAHFDKSYEDIASKFFEHFIMISDAINHVGGTGLWHEETGFYYDILRRPNGEHTVIQCRSFVGLVPLFSVANQSSHVLDHMEGLQKRSRWFLRNRKDLQAKVTMMQGNQHQRFAKSPRSQPKLRLLEMRKKHAGHEHSDLILYQVAIPSKTKLDRILSYVFDEDEFLSPFGIRSLSRFHKQHPYVFSEGGATWQCEYAPAESTSKLFGGNSNWRGPIWFPMQFLLIEALERFDNFFGDSCAPFEFPARSGKKMSLGDITEDLWARLVSLFKKDKSGRRPCFGGNPLWEREHWKSLYLFHEFFDCDTGRGCGASHQTGWTALVMVALNRVAANRQQSSHLGGGKK